MPTKEQWGDRAVRKVQNALRAGVLKKEVCRDCKNDKTVAHHPNHKKPLEVIWLCWPCHRKEHKRMRIQKMKKEIERLENDLLK